MGSWLANFADAEMGLGNHEAAIYQIQCAIDAGSAQAILIGNLRLRRHAPAGGHLGSHAE